MTRTYRYLTTGVLLLLLVSWSTGVHAQEQRRDRFLIQVTPNEESCTYQIQDWPNQDLFIVSPNGRVTVQARRGLWVDVSVDDDPRGVPGTRNRRAVSLRPGEPRANVRDTLVVRNEIQRTTEHRIRIQCCTSRARGQGCPRWVDAQPPSTETGDLNDPSRPLPDDASTYRGPVAPPLPVLPPEAPPGGPVMRIEEYG